MVLAVAVLLLHMGPAVQAIPAAAASWPSVATSAAATPAPPTAPATTSAPLDPLPSTTTRADESLPASPPANPSRAESAGRASPTLRADASSAAAGDTKLLSAIRVSAHSKPIEPVGVDQIPSRTTWLALTIASSSAATFDAYATRRAIQAGATEQDPLMKPFANSSGLYAAIQICPLVLDYTARRMQRSDNPVLRHSWWLPQTVSTGVYLFAGAHNLSVSRH